VGDTNPTVRREPLRNFSQRVVCTACQGDVPSEGVSGVWDAITTDHAVDAVRKREDSNGRV
jgi:hypothetical protein